MPSQEMGGGAKAYTCPKLPASPRRRGRRTIDAGGLPLTPLRLVNFTDQGINTIRDLPQRWDDSRKAIEAAGGSIQFHLTMGEYDIVAIAEFPSDEVAATAALAVGSRGNIRTTTLKAFSEEEARKIVQALPAP